LKTTKIGKIGTGGDGIKTDPPLRFPEKIGGQIFTGKRKHLGP
jgi:hypothetical protein